MDGDTRPLPQILFPTADLFKSEGRGHPNKENLNDPVTLNKGCHDAKPGEVLDCTIFPYGTQTPERHRSTQRITATMGSYTTSTDAERLAKIDANKKLAYEICQKWSVKKGGDVDPFFDLFHDDATFTTIAQEGMLPRLAGTLDKAAFRDWVFKESRVGDVSVKVEGITADEDRLALEASSNMVINNNSYCNRYHWLFEMKEGKISAARFYLDTLFAKEAMRWVDEAEVAQKANH